jgi:hypothetical protein
MGISLVFSHNEFSKMPILTNPLLIFTWVRGFLHFCTFAPLFGRVADFLIDYLQPFMLKSLGMPVVIPHFGTKAFYLCELMLNSTNCFSIGGRLDANDPFERPAKRFIAIVADLNGNLLDR